MKALFVTILLCSTAAMAAETNSVSGLVDEALRKNPELKFYEAEIAVAKANRKTAGALANPEVNGELGQKRVASAEGVAWSVSVMQPFEWPGRLGLRKAIANRDVELAELGLGRFRMALASRVRLAAYQVFAAQEKAKAAGEVAERLRSLRDVLVQRDPAGVTPLLETRVIEATDLTMQRRASEATLERQSALLELNQLRGVSPAEPLVVSDAEIVFQPLGDVESLRAAAQTNNFELRTRVLDLAQSGLRVSLAKNERFPTWSVGPAYSEERAGENERILGMAVSVPLPLWNRNSGNIASAKAKQLQAETALLVAQREVDTKVTDAAARYKTKMDEMSKWRADAVKHFREAAELADRHYRLGAVPVTTYIELQKEYLEAVEALLDTRKEALDAWQELQLLTGKL